MAKYTEFLRNPYTGETCEITGSTEEILNRRCDAQYEKWEKENHIQQMQQSAEEQTQRLQKSNEYLQSLCYYGLRPLSPNEYLHDVLAKVQKQNRIKPTLEDVEKEVGITIPVKALGILPGKGKKKLNNLQNQAQDIFKKQIEDYDQQVKEDEIDYQQRYQKTETIIKRRIYALSKGSINAAEKYYSHALSRDYYSANDVNRFRPEYSIKKYLPSTGEIQLSYRIPNGEEIPAIAKYEYNEKTDTIEARSYDTKTTADWKTKIAVSILLRTAALIFLSDHYERIKTVSITGYLRYYDSAFGCDQYKNVIYFSLPKEVFSRINLEKVNPVDLFTRVLKARISSGLYNKEPYSVTEIDLKKSPGI